MKEKPLIYAVMTRRRPDQKEKFDKWYNETHIPLLLKSEHIDGATRYDALKLTDDNKLVPVPEGESPTYLAIYEFKDRKAFEAWNSNAETADARKEIKESWGDDGFEISLRAVYEPIKTWQK